MEPVAYFVSLGTAVAAYMYFLITKESFDYKPLRQVSQAASGCALLPFGHGLVWICSVAWTIVIMLGTCTLHQTLGLLGCHPDRTS